MDTFMDKLAQKLTAQEMIKANAAADAAELSRLRDQTVEYGNMLEMMKAEVIRNAGNVDKLEKNVHKSEETATTVQENAKKVETLIEAALAKLEELQAAGQDTEKLEEILAELKNLQTSQFAELTDHVHKENVKVYRNVQAVVVEEIAKQNDTLGQTMRKISAKVGAVLGISITALLVAAAALALQILQVMNINLF